MLKDNSSHLQRWRLPAWVGYPLLLPALPPVHIEQHHSRGQHCQASQAADNARNDGSQCRAASRCARCRLRGTLAAGRARACHAIQERCWVDSRAVRRLHCQVGRDGPAQPLVACESGRQAVIGWPIPVSMHV
jgi:hypothetical protein